MPDEKVVENSEKLTCTAKVRVNDGRDRQGRPTSHQETCKNAASEVKIGGILGVAKAVLCEKHRIAADRQAFISKNGWPLGKIKKELKKEGYQQERLPGTGVR